MSARPAPAGTHHTPASQRAAQEATRMGSPVIRGFNAFSKPKTIVNHMLRINLTVRRAAGCARVHFHAGSTRSGVSAFNPSSL